MTDETTEQPAEASPLPDNVATALGELVVEHHVSPTDVWVRVDAANWAATGAALTANGYTFFTFLSAIDWLPSPYGNSEAEPFEVMEKAREALANPAPITTDDTGYAGGTTRFQLLARVDNLTDNSGLFVKADLGDDADHLVVDSWVPHYAGANWHEREAREMFGITFTGHPDPRNIYLPADFEGHPLRKDFPLLARMTRPWPGIVDIEALPDFEGTS